MQPPRFDGREAAERVATPGVTVGLVWTAFGGEVQFVEATAMVGKGELHLTGQLGDIKESAYVDHMASTSNFMKISISKISSLIISLRCPS